MSYASNSSELVTFDVPLGGWLGDFFCLTEDLVDLAVGLKSSLILYLLFVWQTDVAERLHMFDEFTRKISLEPRCHTLNHMEMQYLTIFWDPPAVAPQLPRGGKIYRVLREPTLSLHPNPLLTQMAEEQTDDKPIFVEGSPGVNQGIYFS